LTDKPCIATGKWGCGVFGGDTHLKFVQQIIAAQLSKKELIFCTFGEDFKTYHMILRIIAEKKASIGQWISWMENPEGCMTYYEHFSNL
jgi:poly(ADP-ribose) glycohydrolase